VPFVVLYWHFFSRPCEAGGFSLFVLFSLCLLGVFMRPFTFFFYCASAWGEAEPTFFKSCSRTLGPPFLSSSFAKFHVSRPTLYPRALPFRRDSDFPVLFSPRNLQTKSSFAVWAICRLLNDSLASLPHFLLLPLCTDHLFPFPSFHGEHPCLPPKVFGVRFFFFPNKPQTCFSPSPFAVGQLVHVAKNLLPSSKRSFS